MSIPSNDRRGATLIERLAGERLRPLIPASLPAALAHPAVRVGLLALPALLLLSLLPFLLVLRQSFGEPATLDYWQSLLLGRANAILPFWSREHTAAFLWRPLQHSLLLAGSVTLLATAWGSALACLCTLTDLKYGRVQQALAIAHLILPPFAIAIAWLGLSRSLALPESLRHGPLPMILVLVLHFYPFAFFFTGNAARNLDATLVEAAQVHGGHPGKVVRRIILPLLKPAILGSSALIFFSSLATFAPIQVLGGGEQPYYVLATQIYSLFKHSLGDPRVGTFAVCLALVLTALSLPPFLLFLHLLGKRDFGSIGGRGHRRWQITLGRWRNGLSLICLAIPLVAIIVPLAVLFLQSLSTGATRQFDLHALGLDHYRALFSSGPYLRSIAASFLLAVLAASAGVVMTLPVAYSLQRSRSYLLRAVLYLLSFLPFLLPGVVLGLTYFTLISQPYDIWGGTFSLRFLYGTLALAVLVSVVKYLPYGVQAQASAFLQVDPSLEEAAYLSGAPFRRLIRRLFLPLLGHGALVTWMLLVIFVFKEIDVLAFIYAPQPFQTGGSGLEALLRAPPVMYQVFAMLQSEQHPELYARGNALLLIACLVLLAATLLVVQLGWQPMAGGTQKGGR